MGMARSHSFAQVLIFLHLLHIPGISFSVVMKITNSCEDTICPAIVSKPDSPELPKNMTGFALRPGEYRTVTTPANWTGMVWGRAHCNRNITPEFTCGTGDCGSNAMDCPGGSPRPAATTLVDFTAKGTGGEYAYSVSLANGFNRPLSVVPRAKINGGETCRATGCVVDLNEECPNELQVLGHENEVIGCNSACEEFKESQDRYCGTLSTYSDHFKSFCPSAMAFEDDKTNTLFECPSADYYDINFCASSFPTPPPVRSSHSSSPDRYSPGEKELMDDSGKSIPLVIKIVAALVGIIGGGLLTRLGYWIWGLYHREDHDRPLCNLGQICMCCNHWIFCNCCNHD